MFIALTVSFKLVRFQYFSGRRQKRKQTNIFILLVAPWVTW